MLVPPPNCEFPRVHARARWIKSFVSFVLNHKNERDIERCDKLWSSRTLAKIRKLTINEISNDTSWNDSRLTESGWCATPQEWVRKTVIFIIRATCKDLPRTGLLLSGIESMVVSIPEGLDAARRFVLSEIVLLDSVSLFSIHTRYVEASSSYMDWRVVSKPSWRCSVDWVRLKHGNLPPNLGTACGLHCTALNVGLKVIS